jgi:hypothetical protein
VSETCPTCKRKYEPCIKAECEGVQKDAACLCEECDADWNTICRVLDTKMLSVGATWDAFIKKPKVKR